MNQLSESYKARLINLLPSCVAFFKYLLKRLTHDRVNVNAGYLAYITLLSIVPMLTVLLSILSKFPVFANVGEVLQGYIIENFVPASGEAVHMALQEFVANTGKMSAVGGGFLFIAAVMLISNIDKNLNYIWRVKDKRRLVFSFSMYWMVLTLGPIMVGASIAATSYVTSLQILENETLSGAFNLFLRWLPLLLSFFAFLGLYILVPNKKVHLAHGAMGAAVAAILFELSKKGFALYITQFPSYQLIYGALAAIPILFVWVYLCWMIVLLGAEVTAALGEREHWSEDLDMIHSTAESQLTDEGSESSDSANSTSQ
ncbi:virulence factor BrkB family protein [Vibrio diabolicus]|uniref:virulence factor BrkB family protein n=1 Tax=Vibrio diabolicus TaxID=50719 RepID=UPI00106EA91F|nr:virulence factor BrkB family protein [Vibrio diabolicus]MCZ0741530.1 virulence factor BrkB family protein [Vibrio diabolicus]